MDIKWIVPFLSGLACGIGGTAVTLDRHYSKQFEEEVDILRKNFEDYKKLNPIENSDSNNGERTEYNSSSSESNTGRDEGIL